MSKNSFNIKPSPSLFFTLIVRMRSRTIYWLLIFTLSFFFLNLSEARHHKQLPSAVVIGTVYCDTCFQQDFSTNSHFISGATVAVKCGGDAFKTGFYKEVKTNERGVFKVNLPLAVSKHVKTIKGCSVKLISSSEPFCAVASSATSSSLHLKSKKEGTHIFSAGFFTFKPLKQPELCNQKPSEDLGSSKAPLLPTPETPILPPTTPNPTLPPTTPNPTLPYLPPIPLFPNLPPLPTIPTIPQLPTIPGFGRPPNTPFQPNAKDLLKESKASNGGRAKPTQVFPPIIPPLLPTPSPTIGGIPLPPNPLQPPPLLPPVPGLTPPASPPFLPPIPGLTPPPAPAFGLPPLIPIPGLTPTPPPAPAFGLPPLIPIPGLTPSPAPAPAFGLPPLIPIPGLTPSPPPPPPPRFSFPPLPLPFPPLPFPPLPPFPGIPPASNSKDSSP